MELEVARARLSDLRALDTLQGNKYGWLRFHGGRHVVVATACLFVSSRFGTAIAVRYLRYSRGLFGANTTLGEYFWEDTRKKFRVFFGGKEAGEEGGEHVPRTTRQNCPSPCTYVLYQSAGALFE